MSDDPQLTLLATDSRSQSITRRANKISRKAHRARRSLPVLQPELVADHVFTPVAGVPATRAQCPSGGICVYVRCRFHLALSDADTRAGRPGLGSVPRDERGLTIAVEGHVGDTRPGTTLRPIWLQYRGLEVEREVKVYIDVEGNVMPLRAGALEYWLDRLHLGEPVLVFDDDTGEKLTRAKMTAEGLALEVALPERVLQSSSALVLTRVRGVESCALDAIERKGKALSNEEAGDCIGRHRTLVARENRKALLKGIANARALGMSKDEFLRGLRELGAGG